MITPFTVLLANKLGPWWAEYGDNIAVGLAIASVFWVGYIGYRASLKDREVEK
jgi:hypothetical protein